MAIRVLLTLPCLFLEGITSVASFLSMTKYHGNTTPFLYKVLIVTFILLSSLMMLIGIIKNARLAFVHIMGIYAIHFTVLYLAVHGPMCADDDKIVTEMYAA